MKAVTVGSITWNLADSFGRVALEIERAFKDDGWHVNTVGGHAPNPVYIPTFLSVLIGNPARHPRYGALTNAGRKIALSMFESTQLPEGWVQSLNRSAEVIVPCQWNVDVFKEQGVTVPIHKIPLGVSDAFHYVPRTEGKVFRFLAFGDRGDRKFWNKALFAFIKAFRDRDDVELVLKSRFVPKGFGNKNVREIVSNYTDAEMQALYASCDCLIFPTSGEGFGMPPREFAMTGGLPLVTNYGGLADDLDQWGLPLEAHLEPAWQGHEEYDGLGQWGAVDADELADKLLEVQAMSLEARNEMGKRFSENVERLYSWERFGTDVLRIAEGSENANRISA